MSWISQIDYDLFVSINSCNAAWADEFFHFISLRWVWVPVYILLIYLLIRHYGLRQGAVISIVIICMVVLADIISTQVFKEWVQRLRPCYDPLLQAKVHLYNNDCGGKYGFVSSHAANFGVWCFMGIAFLRKKIKGIGWFFIMSFLLVSYSRIYLGRHFPGDVVAGGLLGIVLALAASYALKKYFHSKTTV